MKTAAADAEAAVKALTLQSTPAAIASARNVVTELRAAIAAAAGVDVSSYQSKPTTLEADISGVESQIAAAISNQGDDQQVMAAYNTAKTLLDNLNNQSTSTAVGEARGAIAEFREAIQNAPNLTEEQQEKYNNDLIALNRGIDQVQGRIDNAFAWENGMNGYSLSTNMTGLPDRISGAPDPTGVGFPNDTTLTSTRNANETAISLTYDTTPLPATPVTSGLESGWTGASFRRNYANGRIDSGRFFSNLGGDESTEWEWDDFWNQQFADAGWLVTGGGTIGGLHT